MKIKRRKRVQKALSFFKNNFEFHPPYKVIVDGTFCQAALKNKVNIEDQIPRYFGSEVKFFTTSCVINETEVLGPALHGAMLIVKKFPVTSCGHEKNPISATQCLHSILSNNCNSEHFILATQDRVLKERVRELRGCPIFSLILSALSMEKPSQVNVNEAIDGIDQVTEREVADLRDMKAQILGSEPVPRKRKRPKGPNPLSCKKKHKKPVGTNSSKEADPKKRRRKRIKPTMPKQVKDLLENAD